MHYKISRLLLVGFIIFTPMYSVAGEVTQYSSVQKMIEEFSDFSTSKGTFKVLKNKPLHIQLSPMTVKRESSELIKETVSRALIYGIYNAFIHTSIDKITVTVIPQEIDLKTRKTKLLTKYKRTISKTRWYNRLFDRLRR